MSSLGLQLNLSNISTTKTALNPNNNKNNNNNNNKNNNNKQFTASTTAATTCSIANNNFRDKKFSITNKNTNSFYSNSFNYPNYSSANADFTNPSTISVSNKQQQQHYIKNTNNMPTQNLIYNISLNSNNNNHNNNNNSTNNNAQNKLNTFTTDNIMEASANTASSIAFINRIKSLESSSKQANKKASNLPNSTIVSFSNNNTNKNTLLNLINNQSVHHQPDTFADNSYLNFTPPQQQQQQTQVHNLNISISPTLERKSGKSNLNRNSASFNKNPTVVEFRLNKLQDSTNPNPYTDKVTDQKFFNRNYKLKNQPTDGEMTTSYNATRYLNDTPSTNVENYQNSQTRQTTASYIEKTTVSSVDMNKSSNYFNQTQNIALQSNSVNLNRLKLLKKRNALKKTLSNAANLQSTSPTSKSHQNFEQYQLHSSSKEDFKSQTSTTNNLTNRAFSMHLSRNSLNNIENSNLGSNPTIPYHKSNETIDELTLNELRQKENKLGINRVRSTPHIMNTPHNSAVNPVYMASTRTKSENELVNLTEAFNKLKPKAEYDSSQEKLNQNSMNNKTLAANNSYLNRVKTVAATSSLIPNRTVRPSSRLEALNSNQSKSCTNNNRQSLVLSKENTNVTELNTSNQNGTVYVSLSKQNKNDDFRIVYPGFHSNEVQKPSAQQIFDMNLAVEAFEPSPYNIMSDPVISEQFRKLYEEDEYFQQVHRKCIEWLNKYVFPEMDNAKKQ